MAYDYLPPALVRFVKSLRRRLMKARRLSGSGPADVSAQDLEVYWDPKVAAELEQWGEGTVWNEIQLLLVNCAGDVLDIACGTGKTMEINAKIKGIELYGCDISDLLIDKAKERGIPAQRLWVGDATRMSYPNDRFRHAYSIGSLEHFTDSGIREFLIETKRVVSESSFHMIPVSRSGRNEGWIKTVQSYHNNSVDWWLAKYSSVFGSVTVLDSAWNDDISIGKWFICRRMRTDA
jgi:SAM-dependent methyltransferase